VTAAPPPIHVASEVAAAIAAGRPVVALESALITHGLPSPRNVEVARAAEAAIREAGATPATVAVLEGRIRVGLEEAELEALAAAAARGDAAKATRRNLAAQVVGGGAAGTTVTATMIAAHHASIRVFATGGIGGVHRGAATSFDISADLDELARTPLVVVCAGPKSILDLDLTLEVLETRGVPVIGWQTDEVAGFLAPTTGRRVPVRADSATDVAAIAATHWGLGLESALLVCVPLPEDVAVPADEVEHLIEAAISEAAVAGVVGPATTPWLLARLAETTGGRSLAANEALIVRNAAVAARIARAMTEVPSGPG
jgi:pseudouridylate synthase